MKILQILLIGYYFVFLLSACAVQKPLSGGEKDERPPKLDSLRSEKSMTTNFVKKPLRFYFDEWLKLENTNQVIVSPPLKKKPVIKLVDKSVVFEFHKDEVLRENATYSINFGETIQDINEGNKAVLKYIFSTGNKIDSQKIVAQTLDALTEKPLENVLFMLYDDKNDSIVTKDIPFYFAKSNNTGFATIENVKEGKFKAFALLDANNNMKYDLPTEKIGFLTEDIDSQDTTKEKIYTFLMSEPQKKLRTLEKSLNSYGLAKMILPISAKDVSVRWEDKKQQIIRENDNDTLKIWYNNTNTENWKIFVFDDTITVRNVSKEEFLKKAKFFPTNIPLPNKNVKTFSLVPSLVRSNKPSQTVWNYPIKNIDKTKILVTEDSTKKEIDFSATIDSLSPRKLLINAKWNEAKSYNIVFLPNAVEDIFEQKNDSVRQVVKIQKLKDFCDLRVNFSNFDGKKSHIVQLLGETGILIEERKVLKQANWELRFSGLSPTNHSLKIIVDTNGNGRWDSVDYYKKLQPETIYSRPIESLKAGWETEIEWDITRK